ncbi:hypothetical protein V1477_002377 [Vespula maculifrons]|uniref:Uncharacterized protein n=1 Tax=Vespula maculifrons TaxID=7453 RepID=A0ABD2CWH4_VESMC
MNWKGLEGWSMIVDHYTCCHLSKKSSSFFSLDRSSQYNLSKFF